MRIYKEFEVKNTSNSILYIRFLFSATTRLVEGDVEESLVNSGYRRYRNAHMKLSRRLSLITRFSGMGNVTEHDRRANRV